MTSVIVDTDAGSDDLMAIAFLLARRDVRIEAVTVCNGLAHVNRGAHNVRRLLALAGQPAVPVYPGRATALHRTAEFPDEWRRVSDELPGVTLPPAAADAPPGGAADYLTDRLASPRNPARLLALGPLTNLGEALQRKPEIARVIERLVIMGGAVEAQGNLRDGGFFKTDNDTAEWNIFVDPLAAQLVFAAAIPTLLIPLDATNTVPITVPMLNRFSREAKTPLGRFVAEILETDRPFIEKSLYYAWDPLAAVAFLDQSVVRTRRMALVVDRDPPHQGRTRAAAGSPTIEVAIDADAAAFERIFTATLREDRSTPSHP